MIKLAGLAGGMVGWLAGVPRWLWVLLIGGGAVLVTLLLFRSALADARKDGDRAGYARAQAEAAAAADAAGRAMVKQMTEAEDRAADTAKARAARLNPLKDKARDYARTAPACPDPVGRLLVNEAVRAANDTATPRGRS